MTPHERAALARRARIAAAAVALRNRQPTDAHLIQAEEERDRAARYAEYARYAEEHKP